MYTQTGSLRDYSAHSPVTLARRTFHGNRPRQRSYASPGYLVKSNFLSVSDYQAYAESKID